MRREVKRALTHPPLVIIKNHVFTYSNGLKTAYYLS